MATPVGGMGAEPTIPPGLGWLDAPLVQSLAPAVSRVVTLPAGVAVQLLGNNPERSGFVVIKSAAMANFPMIGPSPLVTTFGLRETADLDVRTFTLTEWLSLVPGEWYVFSTAGGQVQVFEMQPYF